MSIKGVKVKRSVTLAVVEEWSEGHSNHVSPELVPQRQQRVLWSPRVIAAVVTASAALITAVVKLLLS